jgi:hypothetical protein
LVLGARGINRLLLEIIRLLSLHIDWNLLVLLIGLLVLRIALVTHVATSSSWISTSTTTSTTTSSASLIAASLLKLRLPTLHLHWLLLHLSRVKSSKKDN